MVTVSLHDVSRVYRDGTRAVDALTLDVVSSELLVLTGPSGSGKSTTLRLIAGLEQPTSGTIAIDRQDMAGVLSRDRDVALVTHESALYPHLNARENLSFPLRLRGVPADETSRRVDAEARALGIRGLLHQLPRRLSAGDRQRVALGRATARVPRLFLFDEPLATLDAHERVRLRGEVARLQQGLGVTTVYVTHDQTEAMALGSRIAVLDHGRLQQVAEAQAVYGRPANLPVATFFGSPPMNLLPGEVVGQAWSAGLAVGGQRLPLNRRQADALSGLPGGRVIVGIRAEHLGLPPPFAVDVATLRTDVEHVEALGAHMQVTSRVATPAVTLSGAVPSLWERRDGQARLRFHVPPGTALAEHIDVAPDLSRMHFFDPATGQAVLHPVP